MMPPRILYYVQYLEGIGHVIRARRIIEKLCEAGCEVTLIFGGHPLPGFSAGTARIEYLSPLSASAHSYSLLLTANGEPATDADKAERAARVLAIDDAMRPDVIVTETYPVGRWAMDFELEPLLRQAASRVPRPLILTSLRDILQMPKTEVKTARSIALLEKYYDHLLVHGDPRLVRAEDSFPPLQAFADRITYTGLVMPEPGDAEMTAGVAESEPFDVVVSSGGGATGYAVLEAAIKAKPRTRMAHKRWLALAGPRMPDDEYARLREFAETNAVTFERYRENLSYIMRKAELSIQRAGYNTVGDLIAAGCRAVLVPDAADGQMEQPLRAQKLEQLGHAVVVQEATLTADTLAAAIEQALSSPPATLKLDLEGAEKSAHLIVELCARYQATENGRERG